MPTAIGFVPSKGSAPPHGAMKPHANPGGTRFACDLDREIGRISIHQVTHAVVAIDQRGGYGALGDVNVGTWIDMPAPEQTHIAGKPEYAMGIGPGEIRIEHRTRHGLRIGVRQAAGPECICHEGADIVRRNAAGDFGNAGHETGFLKGWLNFILLFGFRV